MSVLTTAAPARRRTLRVPLLAFVCSRVLVMAAGGLGLAALPVHDPTDALGTRRLLGSVGYWLAGSVDRYDSGFYLDIAAHGYRAPALGHAAFFPLYPLLIRLLSAVTGSAVLAGALISALAFAAALVLLHRVATLQLGSRAADATVWLLALAPLSFYFTAIYTESLFLALSLGAVLAARSGRWRTACALAALATLTRPVGILLGVALVATRVHRGHRVDRSVAWVLALPAALAGYLALLAAGGYGWMAPFHAEVGWHRLSTGPVSTLVAAVWTAARGAVHLIGGGTVYAPTLSGPFSPGAEAIVLLAVVAIALAALAACRRRLAPAYTAYAGAVLLVTLSSPEAGQPLLSQDRYALVLFPLWIVAGGWLSRRPRLLAAVLTVSAGMLVFYTAQFASWSFVA